MADRTPKIGSFLAFSGNRNADRRARTSIPKSANPREMLAALHAWRTDGALGFRASSAQTFRKSFPRSKNGGRKHPLSMSVLK
jgi:hypothetical protein